MFNDEIKLIGSVKIYRGEDLVHEESNLVVNTGKNHIASVLASGGAYLGKYMQVGTGTTSPSATDTDLQTPVGSRVLGTLTNSSNQVILEAVIGQNNPSTEQVITEAGIFTATSGGTLVARITFGGVDKPVLDTLRIIWTITAA